MVYVLFIVYTIFIIFTKGIGEEVSKNGIVHYLNEFSFFGSAKSSDCT